MKKITEKRLAEIKAFKNTDFSDAKELTEKLNDYYKNHNSKIDDDLKEVAYNILAMEDW